MIIAFFVVSVLASTMPATEQDPSNGTIPQPTRAAYLPLLSNDIPPTEPPTPTATGTATSTPTTTPSPTPTTEPTRVTIKLWEGRYKSDDEADSWVIFNVTDKGETISFAGIVMYNGPGCDVLSYTFNGSQAIEDGRFRF
jgi:hypothetical protein